MTEQEKKDGLKFEFIKAFSLPDAWYQCLLKIFESGHEYTIDKGSYEGQKRLEFDYITVEITNPGSRPLVPDIPEGLGVPPPSSIEYVERYLEKIITPNKSLKEDYTYGQRLTGKKIKYDLLKEEERIFADLDKRIKNISKKIAKRRGTNSDNQQLALDSFLENKRIIAEISIGTGQIDKVIEMYKTDGHGTNQATMEIAMPMDIMLNDPPCLRLIDTRIRYGRLHFMLYFRSWDLWAGFPSNLAALQMVKEWMAKEIGVEDGEIIASSKGLHLYDYAWDLAKKRLRKI